MLKPEFEIQINRLIGRYGNKYYPPERMKVLWEKVQYRPTQEFLRAVDYLIGDNQTDPDNKKIMEAVYRIERDRVKVIQDLDEVTKPFCNGCLDCGHLFITADDGFPTWVYCCCDEGLEQMQKHKLGLPRWDKSVEMTCSLREIPIQFFRPKNDIDPSNIMYSLMEKVLEWKRELKDAEKYWLMRINERPK